MKRAAVDISRSTFEICSFATKHDLSEAAVNELLQMLRNVGNVAILFTVVFVRMKSVLLMILNYVLPAGQPAQSELKEPHRTLG